MRELERLDRLLDDILCAAAQDLPLLASLVQVGTHAAGAPTHLNTLGLQPRTTTFSPSHTHQAGVRAPRWEDCPLMETGEPAATRLSWTEMPPPCDPCRVECHASTRMAAGEPRGERKRETVAAFAWLIDHVILPQAGAVSGAPTIIDAGCSTGSLLLPLAFAFPHARFVSIDWKGLSLSHRAYFLLPTSYFLLLRFVGVDLKGGSLARLRERAEAAGGGLSERVGTWQGRIEDYDGPCDAVVALHACGGASDAALGLAVRHGAPFAVSPCCVGKLSRGTNPHPHPHPSPSPITLTLTLTLALALLPHPHPSPLTLRP